MSYIRLVNVTKRFGNVTAVDNLNLEIGKGECFSMLGPSGCGKTTTLRMVAGFEDLSDGEVWVGDRLLSSPKKHHYTPPENRNFGMVFQAFAVWPHMSVYENVAFPLRLRKLPAAEIEQRTKDALTATNLLKSANESPASLSGGGKQRVALARALCIEPDVLLMDEPLSNLDAKLRVQMRSVIKKLQRRLGITTIYVTHDQEEALAISDRIAVMKDGHIMQIGTPRDIYAKPQNPFVAGFIGVSNFLDCEMNAPAPGNAAVSIKGELDITVPVSRAYTGSGKISARPEQLFFSESGMPGTILFSTFLGDFIEYEVQLNDGQNLIVNEYTKDTTEIHSDGEQVHLSFDPMRISLYDKSEEVLSL